MGGMRCAACGHTQASPFPSLITRCFADTTVHATKLENVALELGKVPSGESGDRVIALYVCPNCGTTRIRLQANKE